MIREPVALALSLSKTSFVYLFSRARLLLLACLPRLRVAGASSMPPTITAASNFTRRAHNHNNRRTMGTRLEMEIMLIASLLLSSRRLRAVAKLCKFGRTDRWRRLLAGESETLVGKVAADVLERRPSSICFAFSRPAFNCQSRSFPVRGCSRRRRPSVIVAPPPPVQMLARCAPVVH